MLTSIAVIALIYHNAVPRTQPWHSVLPGAILATGMWFAATACFRLVFAPLRRLQHHLRLARRGHRPPGLDVHDLSRHSGRRRVQRHALPQSIPRQGTQSHANPAGSKQVIWPLFCSKGCPVQAPLGRGCSDVTDSWLAGRLSSRNRVVSGLAFARLYGRAADENSRPSGAWTGHPRE